jgi:hypothetical protein
MATLVQHKVNTSSASANTIAVTVNSTRAGSLLVVGTGNGNNLTITSVTDNFGNPYTQATGAEFVVGTVRGDVWYSLKANSGVILVTVTYNGAAGTYGKEVWFWEVAGFTTAAFDGAAQASNKAGVGTTNTGAALTTTGTTGFVVGLDEVAVGPVSANPQGGNEFVAGGDLSTFNDAGCSLISTTAASHTPVWTNTTSGDTFGTATVAFKETAAAPPSSPIADLSSGITMLLHRRKK